MKYYLIKYAENCEDFKNGFALIKSVELTEQELKHLKYFNWHSWCGADSYKDLAKEIDNKLRKVLDNEEK